MKIYVARFYGDQPLKAFASKEAAEDFCKKANTETLNLWNKDYLPEGEEPMTYEEFVETVEDCCFVEELEVEE